MTVTKDKHFNGFAIKLYFDSDGDWIAHFIELPEISAFGASPEEAISELEVAWTGTKAAYVELGREIPVVSSYKKSVIQAIGDIKPKISNVISMPVTKRAAKSKRASKLYNPLTGQPVIKTTIKRKMEKTGSNIKKGAKAAALGHKVKASSKPSKSAKVAKKTRNGSSKPKKQAHKRTK